MTSVHRSGDGLGIHQPGSNAQGRVRDRANCPAVTRFNFRTIQLCHPTPIAPAAVKFDRRCSNLAETFASVHCR